MCQINGKDNYEHRRDEFRLTRLPIRIDEYEGPDPIQSGYFTFTIKNYGTHSIPTTNMRHLCSLHERADYHWGYLGPPCMNLSLNILEYVLTENPDWQSGRSRDVAYGNCDEVSWYLYTEFCKEFISDLPAFLDCRILYYEVEKWLVEQLEHL
jgi:hypothetical protein